MPMLSPLEIEKARTPDMARVERSRLHRSEPGSAGPPNRFSTSIVLSSGRTGSRAPTTGASGLALGVVVASAFAASLLGRYPFGSRPGLYMVPLAFVLVAEPLDWAMRRRSWGWRVPAGIVAALLAVALAVPSFRLFITPENSSDMKGRSPLLWRIWSLRMP
jgi:hypothetical protein